MSELRICDDEAGNIRVFRSKMLELHDPCCVLNYSIYRPRADAPDMCTLPGRCDVDVCSDCLYKPADLLDAVELFYNYVRRIMGADNR